MGVVLFPASPQPTEQTYAPTSTCVDATHSGETEPDGVTSFQTWLLRSPPSSRVIDIGQLAPGMLSSPSFALPLFGMIAACFLPTTILTRLETIPTFADATLHLLVMARIEPILVLATLLLYPMALPG